MSKLSQDFSSNICIPGTTKTQYVPIFPRKLTQAQLYSVNQIISNRREPNFNTGSPLNSNVFAVIPLRDNNEESSRILSLGPNDLYHHERKFLVLYL